MKNTYSYRFLSQILVSVSICLSPLTSNASNIVFNDPSAASENIKAINLEIAATGKFIKPSGGKIYIASPIICKGFCLIKGETDAHSPIVIPQTFVGDEVIETINIEPPIEIRNTKFLFEQNKDATDRSQLFQFPPFIETLAPRAKFIDVSISGGIDGIIANNPSKYDPKNARGNPGGLYMERVKLGNYGTNLLIDNALDFVFLDAIEFWPFDFAGHLLDIWSDSETVAFRFIDIDGLTAGSLATFRAKGIIDDPENGKKLFGSIGTLQLDGRHASLYMNGGELSIANAYSTSDKVDDVAINLVGGNLMIANLRVSGPASSVSASASAINSANGLIKINGNANFKVANFNDQSVIGVNTEDDIQKLYRTILQREVTKSDQGYIAWSNHKMSGTSLNDIAVSFLRSVEATNLYGGVKINQLSPNNQVKFCFEALLGRMPNDERVIQNFSQLSLNEMVNRILNSPEYQER